MTVKAFSEELSCSRENAHRILNRDNMDIILLQRISTILEHDFFMDLSISNEFAHIHKGQT
ncbi:MAG: hypothetical protein MJY50_03785, partial [Bacteroidales bacterium]|nr:hypothetical protein [Bacteroidales bacterium]